MTVSTQLLLMDKINFHPTTLGPIITSTFKGLTRIPPFSCGFDSSVGRALHWHRRGRGFESRSEPEFFSGLCSSSVTAALALMTVSTQLLLMDKINFQTASNLNNPLFVALGPRTKVVISNILPASTRNELKFFLKIAFNVSCNNLKGARFKR